MWLPKCIAHKHVQSSWRQTFTQVVYVSLDVLAKKIFTNLMRNQWKIFLKINQGRVTKLLGKLASSK